MTKPRRMRWIGLAAVASAGLVSGCYYPYGYYWWGYPYPQFYAWGYPYAADYSYPPTPGAVPPDLQQPPSGTVQPLNAPVQRTPLPPPPQ